MVNLRLIAENIAVRNTSITGLPLKIEFRFPSVGHGSQIGLREKDKFLIHSKILSNLDFFPKLTRLGFNEMTLSTAHFMMNDPGISFYLGSFLFSNLEEVFELISSRKDKQKYFHFIFPINTIAEFELNDTVLKDKEKIWELYYPKFGRGFYLDRPER